MSRTRPRYDASSAALRAQATEASPVGTATVAAATSSLLSPEYATLSVWELHAAPWQSRHVFEHIEELAATIGGSAEKQGVGVLKPLLVQRLADGTYQLIDGERRLRACRLLAERSEAKDYRLPVRIFDVNERVARLMGQTANLEHETPKPYEVALGYQRIREALRAEVGGRAPTARELAGLELGRHKKTQVSDYLRIADALTSEVLVAAGLGDTHGQPDFALLTRLSKKDLLAAARLESEEARVTALRAHLEGGNGHSAPRSEAIPPAPLTPEERRAQISTESGFSFRVRTPAQMLEPGEANALVRSELAPAMLAMVERAHGGTGRDGLYAEVTPGHALLVVPSEVEALSTVQLERLTGALTELRRRADRALRVRRQGVRTIPPVA